MEGVIDWEHAHGVVFCNGQDDEPALQPDVVPLQPQYFAPTHAGGEGEEEASIKPVFFE
jgi:hypothetical protein